MIPPFMMQIDSIPVTKNGKIDKKSLPEIKAPAAKERVEPRNDIERKLLDIYKKVINAEDISVVENFFDIGGNSLKVMQVFSELGEVYPDTVKVVDLFANPSIEQLAVFIEKKLNGRSKNEIKGIVLPEAFFGEFGSEKDRVGRVIDAEVFNKLKSEMSGCLFEFMIAAYVLTLSKLCGSNEITLQCMNDRNGNIHQLTIDLGDTENFLDLVEKIRNDLEDPSLKYNVNDYVKPVFDNKETVTSIIVNGNLKYKYTELFDIAIGVDISDRLEFEGDSHNRRLEQSALADIINGYSEIVNTITDML